MVFDSLDRVLGVQAEMSAAPAQVAVLTACPAVAFTAAPAAATSAAIAAAPTARSSAKRARLSAHTGVDSDFVRVDEGSTSHYAASGIAAHPRRAGTQRPSAIPIPGQPAVGTAEYYELWRVFPELFTLLNCGGVTSAFCGPDGVLEQLAAMVDELPRERMPVGDVPGHLPLPDFTETAASSYTEAMAQSAATALSRIRTQRTRYDMGLGPEKMHADADGHERDGDVRPGGSCNHKFNTNRRMLPGVFTVLCSHGFMLFFTFMMKNESARTLFEFLVSRCPTGALPSTILYDDACHAALYCMRREPALFEGVRWLCDRFHSKNHIDCSDLFQLKRVAMYPAMRSMNTQVCAYARAIPQLTAIYYTESATHVLLTSTCTGRRASQWTHEAPVCKASVYIDSKRKVTAGLFCCC